MNGFPKLLNQKTLYRIEIKFLKRPRAFAELEKQTFTPAGSGDEPIHLGGEHVAPIQKRTPTFSRLGFFKRKLTNRTK